MTTRLWLLCCSISLQGSSKNDGASFRQKTLVRTHLLNHCSLNLQTRQFGDFPAVEILFSKVLNSYILIFCLEYSWFIGSETEARDPCVLIKVVLQPGTEPRLEPVTPGSWNSCFSPIPGPFLPLAVSLIKWAIQSLKFWITEESIRELKILLRWMNLKDIRTQMSLFWPKFR